MTAPSARRVTVCASPKGGQGCTTIAAVLAVLAAQSEQPTLLLDTRGDAAAILGVALGFGTSMISAMALGFLGGVGVAWNFAGWLVFGVGMATWSVSLLVRGIR